MKPRIRDRGAAKSAARGFTLIELMVAITLLGILIVLGLPSFTEWLRNSQVRTVAEALQNGLRTAKSEAVRRNRLVALSFTNATPGYGVTAVAGGKNWSLQSMPQFGETTGEYIAGGALADVASNVTIAPNPTSTATICFNSSGRLATNSTAGCTAAVTQLTVDQTNATRRLRVDVQIGGQVRMCDPNRPTQSATSPDGCP